MGVAAKSNPVRVAIAAWPWGAYLGAEASRRASACRRRRSRTTTRTSRCATPRPSCNYAVSILANQEATHDGYEEAMLLDPQGFVCQGSGENVFIVRDGKLHTPDLSGGALNGITRDTIITFAGELGIPVRRAADHARRGLHRRRGVLHRHRRRGDADPRARQPRRSATARAVRSRPSCRRCSSTPSTAATRRRRRG